jgi:hypothetical protein
MPTALFAAKSVPTTDMESPGSPDVGVNITWEAPLTIIDETAKTDRKSKTKIRPTFLFIQSHLLIFSSFTLSKAKTNTIYTYVVIFFKFLQAILYRSSPAYSFATIYQGKS